MPGPLGFWEILIILVVLLLLFGAKRLPEMGHSLGRGMREFKEAVTGKDDERPAEAAELAPPASASQPAPPASASQPAESERISSSH